MKKILSLVFALAFVASLGIASTGAVFADTPTITEFTAPASPNGGSGPYGITSGPDGNVWFTGWNDGKIGRITPSGAITEFTVPTSNSGPSDITSGPDGNLWFTESFGNKIGRITPSGVVTEFPIAGGSDPTSIVTGSDGNLWFTEEVGNAIGKITPSGVVTEYSVPTANSLPFVITSGPDGNLWFTEENANNIGRITTEGVIVELPIPNVGGNIGPFGSEPVGITAGQDGNLWFTEFYGNFIGQVTPSGVFTQYLLPTNLSGPTRIANGPDGNVWFTSSRGRYIGQLTPAGALTQIPIPTIGGQENAITTGPDANVWFAEYGNNIVGRVNLASTGTPAAITSANSVGTAENVPFDFTVTTTGTPTPAVTEAGALPAGVTFVDNNNGTADLVGTPQAGTAGTYPLTITATNGLAPATQSFVLTVAPSAPVITSASSYSTGMRQPITPADFTITTTGTPTAALSETGVLPSGISFVDNGDGTANFVGQAAAGTSGMYPITITASNGSIANTTQSFTLTITTATSAPAISSSSSDAEAYGVPFSFTVNTTGYPAPVITKTGTLPAGVTFTANGDGTATIAGTPSGTANGLYTLTLKAKSSAGTATQSFTLTITKAPVIKSIPNKTAHAGAVFSMIVQSSGYSVPTLTSTSTLPSGISFVDNGDGTATIAGTPAIGTGGSYPVTVTATNLFGSASKTFTLKVNEAPNITSAASASAVQGSPFSFQATATGFPTPTLSKSGTLPGGVTFQASTGTFSGTPKAGTAGSYPITITAKNSSGTVIQKFVLTVN